jgi:sterol 3beta-glucosyltransferase
MFSPGFFKESLGHFREWLDQRASCLSDSDLDFRRLMNSLPFRSPVFHDAWVACHDADVLIESPSAMAGCVASSHLHPCPAA